MERRFATPLVFFFLQPARLGFHLYKSSLSMVTSILTTIVSFYLIFIHRFGLSVPLAKIRHIF